MSDRMDPTDRRVMVAAQLAAALTKPGDSVPTAVDRFADVLRELSARGGISKLLKRSSANG